MDANQLADAIARAVELAKPAQEYCMFYKYDTWWLCMTKAEWSGWMQFAGAMLALGVAIGLPFLQAWNQRRSNFRLAELCVQRQSIMLATFFFPPERPLTVRARAAKKPMEKLLHMFAEVRPADFSPRALEAWVGAHELAGHTQRVLDEIESGQMDAEVAQEQLQQLSYEVIGCGLELYEGSPGVLWRSVRHLPHHMMLFRVKIKRDAKAVRIKALRDMQHILRRLRRSR